MDKLGKIIESITKPRYEEDFIDRLNYRVTGYVLLLAAFTMIAKEYGGDPIQCWLPAELATQKGWEQYAEDYCFVENTYFVPPKAQIPRSDNRDERKFTYYQWVPFVLLLQALAFTVPHVFWRMLNWTSGIHTRAVITMASNAAKMNYESKEMNELVGAVVKHLDRSLSAKRLTRRIAHSNPVIALLRVLPTSYLSTVYLLTKILFIGNAAFQFWLLSVYLGANGFQHTRAILADQSWEETGFFPRVTLCDFKVKAMGNLHHHTIQCVLMGNMFNEKIFIALWWWILILITFTSTNFVYWVYIVFSDSSKLQFFRGLIQLGHNKKRFENSNFRSFVRYLGGDGVLVFRLMTQNAGEIVSSIIAARLFDMHAAKEKEATVAPQDCLKKQRSEFEFKRGFDGFRPPALIVDEKGFIVGDGDQCTV